MAKNKIFTWCAWSEEMLTILPFFSLPRYCVSRSKDKMMCHVAAQKSLNSLRYHGVISGMTGNPIVRELKLNYLCCAAICIKLYPKVPYCYV